jgi:hypothetical protein
MSAPWYTHAASYQRLLKLLGHSRASEVLKSHAAAIGFVGQLASQEGLDCGLEAVRESWK